MLAALDADNREDREAVRWGGIAAGITGTVGVRGDSVGMASAVGSFFSMGGTGEWGSEEE